MKRVPSSGSEEGFSRLTVLIPKAVETNKESAMVAIDLILKINK